MLIKNIILISALCLIGCTSSKQRVIPQQVEFEYTKLFDYAEDDLMFDFASGFKNDTAKLYLDGKLIFEDKLTSEPSAGYADGITIKKSSESIEIELKINDSNWASYLNLSSGHFFSISYLGEQVEIQQSKIPFYYD